MLRKVITVSSRQSAVKAKKGQKMRRFPVLLIFSLSLVSCPLSQSFADEVYLKNGDRLSGRVLSHNENTVVLEHDVVGTVSLDRASVARVALDQPPAAPVAAAAPAVSAPASSRNWSRQFSLGAAVSKGNTEEGELSTRIKVDGKAEPNEINALLEGYLSEKDGDTSAQRYAGSLRYAYGYGRDWAWYNFFKGEVDHDRFTNIDWRFTPSLGLGYWFSKEEPLKVMAEIGFGWERTQFRNGSISTSEPVVISRGFLEKKFSTGASLSQELTLRPQLGDEAGEFRLKSETVLSNPVTEKVALKLRLIDEYDSNPAGTAEENDIRLTSELAWDF
jgi:putative salt-induced outer membrane protein YdiY